MGPNLFEEIFPNTTVDVFLREGWAERPFIHHGSLSRLPQLQALGDVDNIIELLTATPERGQRAPNVLIARPQPGYRTHFRAAAPNWTPRVAKSFLLRKALRRGESINAESFQRVSPELQWMSDELVRCLGLPASVAHQVETWITPGKKEAIDKHFDNDDRIIIHLAGEKRWWIEANHELAYPIETQHARSPINPSNRPFARDIAIALDMDHAEEFVMKPGSAVFLPRGYWHRTSAVETSAAVMFRFASPTLANLIAKFVNVRSDNCALRVPVMGAWQAHASAPAVERKVGALLADVGLQSISARELMMAFEEPAAGGVGALEETAFYKERAYVPAAALMFDCEAAPTRIAIGAKSVARRDDVDDAVFSWLACRRPCSAQEIAECSTQDVEPIAYRLAQLRLSGYVQDAPVAALADSRLRGDGVLEILDRKSPGRNTMRMCLNADRLGLETSKADAFALLDAFYEAGGNFIDTAAPFPSAEGGLCESERLVGAWITAHGLAERVVVGTNGSASAFKRGDHPARELQGRLKRLGLDRVDLYWMHHDDMNRPVSEIVETLESLKRDGLIELYGASNWRIGRLREAFKLSGRGVRGFVARRAGLSLAHLSTAAGFSATEFARRWHAQSQLPWVAYSVSCAGYFSAQASAAVLRGFIGCPGHERDGPANRRRQFAAAQLAVELGVTSRQVAIAYVLSMDFPTYPILQPLTPAYIREALGALALRLTPAQRARLEGNVEAGKYETTPELVDMATHVL